MVKLCGNCGKKVNLKDCRWEDLDGDRKYFCSDNCFETFEVKDDYEKEIDVHLEDKKKLEEEINRLNKELKRVSKQKENWKVIANADKGVIE